MQQATKETVSIDTLPFFGGVRLLSARFIRQRFSRHVHAGYALGCVEHGAMRFRYMGETVVAPAGGVNLVVPDEPHDGHGATEEGWAYRMFYLPRAGVREAAAALSAKGSLPHFRTGVIDDPDLAACVSATHRTLAAPDVSAMEKETRLYWLLVHWIHRHADESGHLPHPGLEHRAVRRAMERMRAEFASDLCLTDLARDAGLSPFHLARVFGNSVGMPPHAWLTQVRIEQARDRLAGPDRLADIAVDCGFADQPHLTRQFKHRFGVTPGKYRKMLQNS